MYATEEEVEMTQEEGKEMSQKIIFQPEYNKEHGFRCECSQCGTKYFKTWEEADTYAEEYWKMNKKWLKGIF